MPQIQGKRKKFGSIRAITPGLKLPKKPGTVTPASESPTARRREFYRDFGRDMDGAARVLVPPSKRKRIRPVRYVYSMPSGKLKNLPKYGILYNRLIGSRLSDKRFVNSLQSFYDEAARERLSLPQKQGTLGGMMARKIKTAGFDGVKKDAVVKVPARYELKYGPFYQGLLKELKPMLRQLGMRGETAESVLPMLLALEAKREVMLQEGTGGSVAEGARDMISIYSEQPAWLFKRRPSGREGRRMHEGRTGMHETAHTLLRQTWPKNSALPLWKNELFAYSFTVMALYNQALRRKSTVEGAEPLTRKEANGVFRDSYDTEVRKLREHPSEGSRARQLLDADVAELLGRVLRKNDYDVEKAMSEIQKIVYDRKIKKIEDVGL